MSASATQGGHNNACNIDHLLVNSKVQACSKYSIILKAIHIKSNTHLFLAIAILPTVIKNSQSN